MTTIATCPACSGTMVEIDLGSCGVEFCREGCGGLWFDDTELERLDHRGKGLGPKLAEVLAVKRAAAPEESAPRCCPRCQCELIEERHHLRRAVVLDVCEQCLGVFLDGGELAALRGRADTSSELRHKRMKRRSKHLKKQLRATRRRLGMVTAVVGATTIG